MTPVVIICITLIIMAFIAHHAFNLYIDYKCWETSSNLAGRAIELEERK